MTPESFPETTRAVSDGVGDDEIWDWYEERRAIMEQAPDVPDPARAAFVRAVRAFGLPAVLSAGVRPDGR